MIQVLELCQSLRLHSTRANRNRSIGDLQRVQSSWAAGNKLGGIPAEPKNALDWSRLSGIPGGANQSVLGRAAQSEMGSGMAGGVSNGGRSTDQLGRRFSGTGR